MFYVRDQIRKGYCQCKFFGIKRIKNIHISANERRVKDAMNETKDEEPSVTDNLLINAPRYFKLLEWGKNFLNNLDATY